MIDARACVDPRAKIAKDVVIGPWATIGADVEIGAGSTVGSHTIITGSTKIGRNNKISSFCILGEAPQHVSFKCDGTRLEIGDDNIIREYTSLHRGTVEGGGATHIGSQNFIMCYVHIAHDCQIGDHNIFSNNTSLAGHVQVGHHVNFGGFTIVHQKCQVGSYAFTGGGTGINKDITPFVMVFSAPATVVSLNKVGLRRNGFNIDAIRTLQKAYNVIFRQGLTAQQATKELTPLVDLEPQVQLFIDAITQSTRGIARMPAKLQNSLDTVAG